MSYRISPYKASANTAQELSAWLRKDYILARQLEKCPFKKGDLVVYGGKKKGLVHNLITNVSGCHWKGGNQPFFIEIQPVGHTLKDIICLPLKKVNKL